MAGLPQPPSRAPQHPGLSSYHGRGSRSGAVPGGLVSGGLPAAGAGRARGGRGRARARGRGLLVRVGVGGGRRPPRPLPGSPGRLRPRRRAEPSESPGSLRGSGAAWAPGGGRRAAGRPGPRGGRRYRPGGSHGAAAAGREEARAGETERRRVGRAPGPSPRPLIPKYSTEQGKPSSAAHTTSEAENAHTGDSGGCSLELFLKG